MNKIVFGLSFLTLSGMLVSGCQKNQSKSASDLKNNHESLISPLVVEKIDVWKQELVNSGQLGAPCSFGSPGDEDGVRWTQDNPNQLNGFPDHYEDISAYKDDLNGDGKEDLLLWFLSKNCTGHNGGTPSFAKIIYNEDQVKPDVMQDIRTGILNEYNHLRETHTDYLEVTDFYLRETVTIDDYSNGNLSGVFRLYTPEDAHCCPTYSGSYVYSLPDEVIYLEVKTNAAPEH